MTALTCPCGCGLTTDRWEPNDREMVFEQITARGPTIRITIQGKTWVVPRLYVAFHGLRASNLPKLAAEHHWPEVERIH